MVAITYYNDSSYRSNVVINDMVGKTMYWKNPEYFRTKTREWYARMKLEDPQSLKEYHDNYYRDNKDHIREWSREYRKKNKEEIAWKKNEYNIEKRIKALNALGSKCIWCGYDKDVRALQIDRINGGHRKWAKENKKDGHQLNRWIILHPKEAKREWQVLCANCNRIKAITNNEMPRKYKRKPQGVI